MNKFVGTLLVALVALGSAAFAQDTTVGDWLYIENADRFTDENNSFIVAPASDYPSYYDLSGLIIRCAGAKQYGVDIFFDADQYLGSDDYFSLVYRIDREPSVPGSWGASVSGKAVFVPNGQIPVLIQRLQAASEFAIRIETRWGSETYVVPVSGLRGAVAQLGCYTGTL